MPTEQENIQYLYLVLIHGGAPNINWDVVGAAMDLKKGAVSKRWSRLKQSMEKGETPSGSVYTFLWLCLKHSSRDKAMNWQEIADACNTTAGAASKRYSRMKQAFEAGEAAPRSQSGTPAPKTLKSATRKTKSVSADDDGNTSANPTPTPAPKRKRVTPKKKVVDEDAVNIKNEPEVEDDENIEEKEQSPKKPKITKPKATPKPKGTKNKKAADIPLPTIETTKTAAVVKEEVNDDEADTFVDAKEWVNDLVDNTEDSMTDHLDDWLQEHV